VFCFAAWFSSYASGADWKFNTSINYETGDFGTGTRSNTTYIPFTLKRYYGSRNIALTVPHISQSSNGQLSIVGGTPVRIGKKGIAADETINSGLGDIILRGGYELMRGNPDPFDLSLIGNIKFPTANEDKGLGTGEFDEGIGLEFGKLLCPRWTLLVDIYYTVIGDPPGMELNNQTAFDMGFFHQLRNGMILTALYERSNALVSGNANPSDLRGIIEHKIGKMTRVFGGMLIGLSDGSPDFGISFGVSCRF